MNYESIKIAVKQWLANQFVKRIDGSIIRNVLTAALEPLKLVAANNKVECDEWLLEA